MTTPKSHSIHDAYAQSIREIRPHSFSPREWLEECAKVREQVLLDRLEVIASHLYPDTGESGETYDVEVLSQSLDLIESVGSD